MSAFLSEEADFLAKVAAPNVTHHACKRKGCRFYGREDQWLKSLDNLPFIKYRCPNCAIGYKLSYDPRKPDLEHDFALVFWVVNPCTGKKVMCTTNIITHDCELFLHPPPKNGVPVPAVAEDASQGHKKSEAELLLELDRMLAASFVPAQEGYQHFPLKPRTLEILRNSNGFQREHVWNGHASNGFYGNILPVEAASQQAFDRLPYYTLLDQLWEAGEENEVKLTPTWPQHASFFAV